jgi:hypothetical protein
MRRLNMDVSRWVLARLLALLLAAGCAGGIPAWAQAEDSQAPRFWYSSFAVYTQEGLLQDKYLPARSQILAGSLRDIRASFRVPDQGVDYGANVKQTHSILVEFNETKTNAGQVSQDVAYVLDETGGRQSQVPLLGFEDCPLLVDKDLAPVTGMETRQKNEITIEAVSGKVLQVRGPRFFATDGSKLIAGCEMLPNTVWVFQKKGVSFETTSYRYSVERDGATLEFTRGGVVLTGITRVKR